MDQELLREYRTLHTLQRALEDAGKAADYLSRRLEQAGFRITGQGTAVLAIRTAPYRVRLLDSVRGWRCRIRPLEQPTRKGTMLPAPWL